MDAQIHQALSIVHRNLIRLYTVRKNSYMTDMGRFKIKYSGQIHPLVSVTYEKNT